MFAGGRLLASSGLRSPHGDPSFFGATLGHVSVDSVAPWWVSFGYVSDTGWKFRELWPRFRLVEHTENVAATVVCPNLVAGMAQSGIPRISVSVRG